MLNSRWTSWSFFLENLDQNGLLLAPIFRTTCQCREVLWLEFYSRTRQLFQILSSEQYLSLTVSTLKSYLLSPLPRSLAQTADFSDELCLFDTGGPSEFPSLRNAPSSPLQIANLNFRFEHTKNSKSSLCVCSCPKCVRSFRNAHE